MGKVWLQCFRCQLDGILFHPNSLGFHVALFELPSGLALTTDNTNQMFSRSHSDASARRFLGWAKAADSELDMVSCRSTSLGIAKLLMQSQAVAMAKWERFDRALQS